MAATKRHVPLAPEWVGEERRAPWGMLDRYDRASLAVDCVLLTPHDTGLGVVVHRRAASPDEGKWALPGVFVNYGESLAAAVGRTLKTKVGLSLDREPHQVAVDNHTDRDARGWVVTVAYVQLLPAFDLEAVGRTPTPIAVAGIDAPPGSDISESVNIRLDDPSQEALVLGHNRLVGLALEWLRREAAVADTALDLMPETFTLRQLQGVYEAIHGRQLNKDSFRRSVTKSRSLVEATGQYRAVSGRQAAELYCRTGSLVT